MPQRDEQAGGVEEALKHDEDALVAHLDEAEVSVKASAIAQPDDSRVKLPALLQLPVLGTFRNTS